MLLHRKRWFTNKNGFESCLKIDISALTVTAKKSGQGYIGTNVFLSGIFCCYCYPFTGVFAIHQFFCLFICLFLYIVRKRLSLFCLYICQFFFIVCRRLSLWASVAESIFAPSQNVVCIAILEECPFSFSSKMVHISTNSLQNFAESRAVFRVRHHL